MRLGSVLADERISILRKEESDLRSLRMCAQGRDFGGEFMSPRNNLSSNIELRELRLRGNEIFQGR